MWNRGATANGSTLAASSKSRRRTSLAWRIHVSVASFFGRPQKRATRRRSWRTTSERVASEPHRIATALAPLGWIYHGLAHVEAYGDAATLVEQGKLEEAEEVLVQSYNEEDHAFIRFYNRIFSLYHCDERHTRAALCCSEPGPVII
jgi:hypothetical protein